MKEQNDLVVVSIDLYRDGKEGTMRIDTVYYSELGPMPLKFRVDKNNESIKIYPDGQHEIHDKMKESLNRGIETFVEKTRSHLKYLENSKRRVLVAMGLEPKETVFDLKGTRGFTARAFHTGDVLITAETLKRGKVDGNYPESEIFLKDDKGDITSFMTFKPESFSKDQIFHKLFNVITEGL